METYKSAVDRAESLALLERIVDGCDLPDASSYDPEQERKSQWISTLFEPVYPEDEFLTFLPPSIKQWTIGTMKNYWEAAPTQVKADMNKRKILHTKNVMRNAHAIALGTPEINWNLPQVQCIAALHDICRFPQAFHFSTFKDGESFDHAIFSAERVARAGLDLDKLGCDEYEVWSAIAKHSRLEKPQGTYEAIIRDADKETIFGEYLADVSSISDKIIRPISLDDTVFAQFMSGEVIPHSPAIYMPNPANRIVQRMSWMNDLNFAYTNQSIIRRGYFDDLYSQLSRFTEDKRLPVLLERITAWKADTMGALGISVN